MNKIFYNLICAATVIQHCMFGKEFEIWGQRIIVALTSIFAVLILYTTHTLLALNIYLSIVFAALPFGLLFNFYRKDKPERMEIELLRFKKSRLTKLVYCSIVVLIFFVTPLVVILFLVLKR